MSILTRYLLRTHFGPFVFSLSVLTGMLFVNTVARRFGELAGKGLQPSVILEVFALSLPPIIALTLPMAVFVAVLYSFSALSAENEITAIRASGTNLARLLMPLLAAGVLLTGFMIWFHDRVLPNTNHALVSVLSDIARKSPTFQLKEQIINPIRTQNVRTQYFLQSATIDHATNRLVDVVIYDLSLGQKARTVYADSGHMALNAGHTDLFLTLYDGWVHEMDGYQSQKFQRIRFTEYLMMIPGVGDAFSRIQASHRSDREMSLGMLRAAADTYRVELDSLIRQGMAHNVLFTRRALAGPKRLADDPARAAPLPVGALYTPGNTASFTPAYRPDDIARAAVLEMNGLRGQVETLQQLINERSVEYHKKIAIPFACVVFVLLGAPLAVRFPRGGVGMVIAFSAVVFAIYHTSLHGGEKLGDRGIIAPFWGPWAPNIMFLGVALWGVSRIGHETSTARDDFFAHLFAARERRGQRVKGSRWQIPPSALRPLPTTGEGRGHKAEGGGQRAPGKGREL